MAAECYYFCEITCQCSCHDYTVFNYNIKLFINVMQDTIYISSQVHHTPHVGFSFVAACDKTELLSAGDRQSSASFCTLC